MCPLKTRDDFKNYHLGYSDGHDEQQKIIDALKAEKTRLIQLVKEAVDYVKSIHDARVAFGEPEQCLKSRDWLNRARKELLK